MSDGGLQRRGSGTTGLGCQAETNSGECSLVSNLQLGNKPSDNGSMSKRQTKHCKNLLNVTWELRLQIEINVFFRTSSFYNPTMTISEDDGTNNRYDTTMTIEVCVVLDRVTNTCPIEIALNNIEQNWTTLRRLGVLRQKMCRRLENNQLQWLYSSSWYSGDTSYMRKMKHTQHKTQKSLCPHRRQAQGQQHSLRTQTSLYYQTALGDSSMNQIT